MMTSDIVGRGSRPLTNLSSAYYRQRRDDVLSAGLRVDVEQQAAIPSSYLDSSRFEFPGDRTYERYLANRSGV